MARNIVLSPEQIQEVTTRLGLELNEALKGAKKVPLIVGVMKGSLNFMMDLIKHITVPIFTDYIHVSSYEGTASSGRVRLYKDIIYDCSDRIVVIVEDVVDTGLSMQYLINHVNLNKPEKIIVCSLLDKKNARQVPVQVDFAGVILEKNDFLIGYGLDYNELERNLPYIYSATPGDVKQLDAILEQDKQ